MTTFLKWLNNRYLLGSLLFAGVATNLVLIGQANDLSKSDWGTWVGALGTVATLTGTVVLARQETNRRRRQERDAAVIAAGFMSMPLVSYCATLTGAIKFLKLPVEDDFDNPWERHVAILKKCPVWTREDLQPLIYLEGHVAANLAIAQDYVRTATEFLDDAAQGKSNETLDLQDLSLINSQALHILEHAYRRMDRGLQSCDKLLEVARR